MPVGTGADVAGVRVVAAPPTRPVEVPAPVRRLVAPGGPEPVAVWENQLGGLTFALGERYVKWHPAASDALASLDDEAVRLRWAARWTPVPEVLASGRDDEGSWLVTRALPARSAVDPRWVADADVAVRAIGAGLRALHDALPVDGCPFDWGVAARLAAADARDGHDPDAVAARAELVEPPPVDRLVVCHGDACAPNTLLADDGTWAAHVDLGSLGVADRWADLAVAAWSTEWNYGPGYEDALLEAYGVGRDDARSDYYRRLWDAT